jgi:hypothetical protein
VNNPLPISSITNFVWVATVTTAAPHNRVANDWVTIAGARVNGSLTNNFNGSYKITEKVSDTVFKYTMTDYTGLGVPATAPTGEMWVGRVPSHFVGINPDTDGQGNSKGVKVTPSGNLFIVRITTVTPHFRVPGNNVVVGYVNVTSGANGFNGAFTISAIVDPVTLEYVVATNPGTPAASQFFAIIGVAIHGPSAEGGTAAVVEGNRIYNCRLGNYGDTFSTKDSIVRNNHFRNVATGPYRQLGVVTGFGVSTTSDMIALMSLTNSGTTATATTSQAHGFAVNDQVIIAGATGPDANYYNSPVGGSFQITAITSTTFQYQMIGSPSGTAQGSPGYATADEKTYRQRLLASLAYALENGVYVATAQTSYAQHGFSTGDAVKISKATGQMDQAHNDFFNLYHTITDIPDVRTFKYSLVDNPNPPNQSGSSPSGYFGRFWQVGRLVIENNLIELITTPTSADTPAGSRWDMQISPRHRCSVKW